MGYIIEITEGKAMDLKDKAGRLLQIGKEMYDCIGELAGGSHMGERGGSGYGGRYGNRDDYGGNSGGYGNRMGERGDDDWSEDDERFFQRMGERRERSSRTGRFVRR